MADDSSKEAPISGTSRKSWEELKSRLINSDSTHKTLLARDAWECPSIASLVLRPRRFGKSFGLDLINAFYSIRLVQKGRSVSAKEREEFFLTTQLGKEYPEFVREHCGKHPVLSVSLQNWGCSMNSAVAKTRQKKKEKEDQVKDKEEKANVFMKNIMFNMVQLFRSYKYLIRDQDIAKRLEPGVIQQFEEYLALNQDRRQADLDREKLRGREDRTKPLSVSELQQNANPTALVWNALSFLADVLQEAYGKPCLVLIDEFDSPFDEAHQSGILNNALDLLSPMLRGVLKGCDAVQRSLIVGVSRIAKSSIFRGINNLVVYPFHDCNQLFFADKLGFTEEEVVALCLKRAIRKNIPISSVLESANDARSYYNGYIATDRDNYSGSSVQVYNPWSIMRFISTSTLGNYWLETTNAAHYIMSHLFTKLDITVRISILADVCRLMSRFERPRLSDDLKEDAISFRAKTSREECVSLFREPQDQLLYEELDRIVSGLAGSSADQLWSYLYMAGYLAAIPQRIIFVGKDGTKEEKVFLQYFIPNEEVYNAWTKWIRDSAQESVIQDRLLAAASERTTYFDALYTQNVDDFVTDFGRFLRVFLSAGFCSYSEREAVLQLHLVAALTVAGENKFTVRHEVNSGSGRLDIMVSTLARTGGSDTPSFGLVFELKFVRPVRKKKLSDNELVKVMDAKVEESLSQIANNHYVDVFVSEYPDVQIIYGIGISLSAQYSWFGVTRYFRCKDAFQRERDFVTYSYKEVGETVEDILRRRGVPEPDILSEHEEGWLRRIRDNVAELARKLRGAGLDDSNPTGASAPKRGRENDDA